MRRNSRAGQGKSSVGNGQVMERKEKEDRKATDRNQQESARATIYGERLLVSPYKQHPKQWTFKAQLVVACAISMKVESWRGQLYSWRTYP